MFEAYLGYIGLILLVVAWIPETLQNWKERGHNLNLKFVCLYLFGSLFLSYHAIIIHDPIFMCLNLVATCIALFNAIVILVHPKIKKTKVKQKKKK